GIRVTLFDGNACLLGRDDPELTRVIADHMRRFGVDLRLSTRVRSIGPDQVEGAPGDLVLLATGLKPNVEIAAEAGVERGRTGAIRVDEHMQTSLSGVYAAGDCAEAMHLVTGRPAFIPLGTTANKMGRAAGANAAGARERFAGVVG